MKRYQVVHGSFNGTPVGKLYKRRAYAFRLAILLNAVRAHNGDRSMPYGVLVTF